MNTGTAITEAQRHRMTYPFAIGCDEHRSWMAYAATHAEAEYIADDHSDEAGCRSMSIVRRPR